MTAKEGKYANAAELSAAHTRADEHVKRLAVAQQKEAQLVAEQDYSGAERARQPY